MTQSAKENTVHQVFESISRSYDSANIRISLGLQKGWKKRLIDEILKSAESGGPVLDVCCGTGDIALSLAARGSGISITGLDFSPAMLSVAKEKGAGYKNITWQEGDAMSLPYDDGSFSAAAISFGLRNTPDYGTVLSEMMRVVRPGGYVFCLDSFVPDSPIVLPFYRLYFRRVMPLLGGGKRYKKEYQWLCNSTQEFLRKSQLTELLCKTGLQKVSCKSFLFGACVLHIGKKP